MANEDKKDFNSMLHDNKDMPKIQVITDQKSIEKYGTYSPTTAKGASGADINAMSDDEIMRWARAADAGVPLALYPQELEPYTQEDVTAARRLMQNAFGQGRIEMLDGTTRTELVRLNHDAAPIDNY